MSQHSFKPVSGKMTSKGDTSILSSNPQRLIFSSKITMFDITKIMDLPIIIIPTEDKIIVNSSSPIIISGADF